VVDSWQQRQLVGIIAQGVKGVNSIENNIIVNVDDTRSDEEIQREIQNALMMDSRIQNNRIIVTVNDGRVELSGAVGSVREKTLAFEQSHVAGVESVSVDNLEVHPEFRSQMFRNGKLTSLTSEDIRKAVDRSLRYDPRVPESRITVTVKDGTVTLKGKVNNLNAKLAAERDALHTAGVNTVDNEIVVEHKVVVRPDIPITNEAIAARIREAIVRNPYVEQNGFEISVRDGVVELRGTTDTRFEKEKIAELAANVMGVIAVDNEISTSERSTAEN
jgi:osmotically-inducible protein OsmY